MMIAFRLHLKNAYGAWCTGNIALPALQGNLCTRKHTTFNDNIQDPIVVTDDGSTIVCWHPEKEFPYEFTKPLPEHEEKPVSVLKTSEEDVYKVFKKQSPEAAREELMKLTYTTKHRWFPRSRDKKAKKTPADRPYL